MAEAVAADKIFPRIVAVYAVIMIIGGTYLSYRPHRVPAPEAVTVAPMVEPVR